MREKGGEKRKLGVRGIREERAREETPVLGDERWGCCLVYDFLGFWDGVLMFEDVGFG